MSSSSLKQSASCVIATWFVADDAGNATYFPQIETRSDSFEAQAIYWRCVIGFFASSLAVNPDCRHVFFTNAKIPVLDGLDLEELLIRWRVEVVHLDITRRLPRGSVSRWGNQFYVFDVIEYWASNESDCPLVLLDSDCVWIRSARQLTGALAEAGALTYVLELSDGAQMNGLSPNEMARFVASNSGVNRDAVPYCAGEFIAATGAMVGKMADLEKQLWPAVMQQSADSPREEAHLLSIIYAMLGVAPGAGNQFIRRMWTTFRYNDVSAADMDLTVWHLPAEKRTGFADLYRQVVRHAELDPREGQVPMGLNLANYSKIMGVPQRSVSKFAGDLLCKLRTKIPTYLSGRK